MGAKSQPATTTQIQKVELPKWVDDASQSNYKTAEAIGNTPFKQYNGNRVAMQSEQEKAAGGILTTGMQQANGAFGQAMEGARAGMDFRPDMIERPDNVEAQGFLSRNINDYMDPFNTQVTDYVTQGMEDKRAKGMQGVQDAAIAAGARTGSRNAIERAVYGAQADKDIAGTRATLRSAAFQDAGQRIQQDNASKLQADIQNQTMDFNTQSQNQQAGIAGAGVNLQGAQLAGQTGQQYSDTAGRNALLSSQLGAQERAIRQQKLDAKYSRWAERKNAPTEALNLKMAALGMSPYGKTSTTTGTSQSESTSSPMMQGIGAAATLLPILFSDRKVKKNIKKLGKVGDTDLNEYEFEYKKGFMGHGPGKQRGLMAQDVEKKVPDAVGTVGVKGKPVKVVNYETAIMGAPKRDKRDDKGKLRGTYKPRVGIGGRLHA